MPQDYVFVSERGNTLVALQLHVRAADEERLADAHFVPGWPGWQRAAHQPAHESGRAWRDLRLLSSAGTTYRDYHGENAEGAQMPMLNVFVKRDGAIRHFYGSELLYAPDEPDQNARHNDLMSPLWNVLDLTPEGARQRLVSQAPLLIIFAAAPTSRRHAAMAS